MRKWTSILVSLLVIYTVYHDVTKGTLIHHQETTAHVQQEKQKKFSLPYQTVEIKAGDTLVSIVEQQQKGPLPVPIDTLIRDFESLNPGVKATALQIGKSYKIPVYRK
ncbi:MAG: LysM domain-containing protein [Anoxybacillus sp.]|nr:LysM domain-containing protein [Anoxybacillus sp.]MCL6585384.1 LysM domain-containing protein [Anoxybacillus sp.]